MHSPSTYHRAKASLHRHLQPGTVLSFTVLAHPPKAFGKSPRTIALIELDDGTKTLGHFLADRPQIGQRVHPRMRLSHVTAEKLRIYDIAYEAIAEVPSILKREFPGYILALTGPSGVGKTTVSRLLATGFHGYTVNVPILTTRKPKHGDEGEYVYASEKEFDALKNKGAIVAETEIPSATERRRYGYRAADIEAIWKEGKLPVVITEMHLLQELAAHYGRRSILSFGLLPPGRSRRVMLSQLLHRLRTRGRDSEAHIKDRLKNAARDLAFFVERKDLFDHLVVNENLDTVMESFRKRLPDAQK